MDVPGFQANLRQPIYACKLLFITFYPQETRMSLFQKVRQAIARDTAELLDLEALRATLDRLVADGAIPQDEAEILYVRLPRQIVASRYALGHLGAHFAISAIFAFDVLPIPLATIGRVSWVAGNRLVESIRGNRDRARVHSLSVLAVAAIPWLGIGAYLLPLRRHNAELTFVLANRVWLSRKGRTYEEFAASAPLPIRRLARWLVPAWDRKSQKP
jgi:hypothetical protein